AAHCHGALEQLRTTLGGVADEATGTREGVRALGAEWTELRTGLDGFARTAGTTEVLAVNAALAAQRNGDARTFLEHFANEADEVAQEAARALARVTGVVAACEQRLTRLAAADAGGR